MIGKISMMLVSFPVVETLLKTLGDMCSEKEMFHFFNGSAIWFFI